MLLFFTPIDNQIFDLFLRIIPSLTENEKVFVLTLDDDSMAYAGGFPFRREVMADVLILLKELGVDTIAFDLSFLDESALRFNSDYAINKYYDFLDSGYINNLYSVPNIIPYLAWDIDEYLANAIAFSGNSWLTLTFQNWESIISEDGRAGHHSEEIDRYLAEHIALRNVLNTGDTKTRDMGGVIPAISKLLTRSVSAGFVNAPIDSDGLRRRVNLLHTYNGDYYGQLTLMAIQEKLGWTSIETNNRHVTLKLKNGQDIRIPRAEDGTILLKWPKKDFYEYNYVSMIELIQYTMIESDLAQNLRVLDQMGYFYAFWNEPNPLEYFLAAEELKEISFENNAEANDDWFWLRQKYLDSLGEYLYGGYEEEILDLISYDEYLVSYTLEIFDACRRLYNRLIDIRINMEKLNGSFIVIGSDATSMMDIGITTFSEFFPNVGTYIVLANMLLSGEFLDDAPWFVSAIIALLYSFLIGFLINRFDTYKSIITGISGLLLLTGIFMLVFIITKTYIPFAVPLAATFLTFITIMIVKFLTTSREKAFIHNAFSRYLAPEVITQIINDPDKLNLGGEKRELTAIFTDIQGFATISEHLDPTNLVKLLNMYLTRMSNIIMENQGTIDKYEGDAIIAFWGAPLHTPNHPVLACRSALAMKAAEREINKTVVADGLSPVPLFTRIGINSGDMVVGNMGAENKMDYTIMGNAVNLTARLEGVNKQYRTGGILISEYTRGKIGDEFLLRRLDRVRVVGINTPLRLYELLALNDSNLPEQEKNAVEMWEQAIDLYEQKRFKEAFFTFKTLMEKNPDDKVAELYAERCRKFMESPPPETWDAVNNLTEK